jgi:hypothetical protein
VWGYVHQPLHLFIICLNFTFIHSYALSHRVKAQSQLSIKHKSLTHIHSLAQSHLNYLHLAQKTSPYTIYSSLFILLQTLTIGPNMGRTHGPTSHKPITKTLEDPLLVPHTPQNKRDPRSQLLLGTPSSTSMSNSKSGPNLTKVSSKLGQGPTSTPKFEIFL